MIFGASILVFIGCISMYCVWSNKHANEKYLSSTVNSAAMGLGTGASKPRSGKVLPPSQMRTPAQTPRASPLRAPNESPQYVQSPNQLCLGWNGTESQTAPSEYAQNGMIDKIDFRQAMEAGPEYATGTQAYAASLAYAHAARAAYSEYTASVSPRTPAHVQIDLDQKWQAPLDHPMPSSYSGHAPGSLPRAPPPTTVYREPPGAANTYASPPWRCYR